jgi:ribosomal protein L11 methyltransferase
MRVWPALRLSGLATSPPGSDTPTGDLIHAALAEHPVAAIEEISDNDWHVFFAASDERYAAATAVTRQFPMVAIELIDVPDGDWAAKSQASLRAVHVGNLIVAPPWDAQAVSGTTLIVIQPSMGFGTAHHATTRLCLRALQQTSLADRRVLDVGTGSGVLAIAASLLDAGCVDAIDDDADAIQAARENLDLNPGSVVRLEVVDLRRFEGGPFDVVTANLTGGLLMSVADRLERLTSAGGTLILSGLMAHEAHDVLGSFAGCTVVTREDEDEWVCVTLERRSQV